MLFKPKFCCNCGESIERLNWGLTSSRRFCEICETDLLVEDWAATVTAVVALLAGMFGTAWLMRSDPAPIPTVVTEAPKISPAVETQNQKSEIHSEGGSKNEESKPTKSAFACGALTKKGTACTRRVGVKGEHCWQHKSAAAARGSV